MQRLQPKLLTSFHGYTRAQLGRDIIAGLIVGVIALPLSIALALASGVRPVSKRSSACTKPRDAVASVPTAKRVVRVTRLFRSHSSSTSPLSSADIARRKAGIEPRKKVALYRFEVVRHT